jgi:hypothetical protein
VLLSLRQGVQALPAVEGGVSDGALAKEIDTLVEADYKENL